MRRYNSTAISECWIPVLCFPVILPLTLFHMMLPRRHRLALRVDTMYVSLIYRYPVKGLSPEPLATVALAPKQGLPQDRRFALARAECTFDPEQPEWLPKTN